MIASVNQSKVLFISTYPPVICGIASFTQDLVNTITTLTEESYSINVCALDKKNNAGSYDSPVSIVMDGHNVNSCMDTAGLINKDPSIKLVCIEHEFGLYGGELGEYLLAFLAILEKPFVICYHTVLPDPEAKRLKIVRAIGLLAEKVIVMTNNSARLLSEDYEIAKDKIVIIPHGLHANSAIAAIDLKLKYNLVNKQVLTTFGLLSPNKGIEKGILAMKEITREFPEAVYIVLGRTHPNLIKEEGEKYRNYLQQLIDENDLAGNVRLVNEYAPTEKLMEYLSLTDIYLFTSKDPNQAVSGTFLYAMSAGCPIISNSFVLAEEMLDKETGIILKTNQAGELAENAIHLLRNDDLRTGMGHNAFLKTRNMTWEKVAGKHISLFNKILEIPVYATGELNKVNS